jgi:hypothetical protein
MSNPIKLAVSWALVAVPQAWGVYHTVLNASKLFS